MNDDVRVLYIGGAGRSGTTLLSLMLGQIDGVFAAGEVTYIWDRGARQDQLCGCGKPFSKCEFWSAVIKEGFGSLDEKRITRIDELRKRLCHTRQIPRLRYSALRSRRFQSELNEYSQIMAATFHAIRKVSGCKVIVDSTKYPAEGYLIQSIPGISLSVVHMVRHVLGVVYSWQRKKVRTEIHWQTELFPKYHPFVTTMAWLIYNQAFHHLGRLNGLYHLLRYEDLVEDTKMALEKLAPLADEVDWNLAFIQGNRIGVKQNHTVTGNPIRFQQGAIDLSPDLEWRAKTPQIRRLYVNALAWPQIRQYGYYKSAKRLEG